MIRVKQVLITAGPVIGANYAVFTEHREGNAFREVAVGILSPVVALDIPAYVILKVG